MPLYKFSNQQLNYFKFVTIVLDEIPKALRQTFVFMWNNKYGGPPTNMPWNDSVAMRNLLHAQEHKNPKIPTKLSYTNWDCTALFQTTLFAHSFKLPDAHGLPKTLYDTYIKPLGLSRDAFHITVSSSTGNQAETFALAIDQLRRLRNTTCHETTERMDKATFDDYMKLTKECFSELGLNTAVIDNIAELKEEEFTADRYLDMYEQLRKERNAMDQFLKEEVMETMEKLREQISGGKMSEPTLPKSCLPSKIPHFTGRDKECAEIFDHLTTRDTKFVSVWGSPGFGKTSVATAVGHQLDTEGHPVLLVSLRKVKTLNEMARRILMVTQQVTEAYPDQISPVDKVLLWLSSVSTPLFLFLDNADDLVEAQKDGFVEFLEAIFKNCKPINLLCTTRESIEYTEHLFETFPIRIRQLDKSSCHNLIRALQPNVTDAECEEIGRVCGNVPLAIRLVYSLISHGSLPLKELLSELASPNTSFLEALDMTRYPENLRLNKLFEHCFRNIAPEQQQAFISLSVFNGTFHTAAAVAVIGTESKLEGQQLLEILERKSLIEHDATSDSYSIHPLLHSFGVTIGKSTMQAVYKDAQVHFSNYYLNVLEELNKQFLTGQSSSAYTNFQKQEHSILQALKGNSEKAMRVLSKAEVFLDSIYWNISKLDIFKEIYDKAIKVVKEQQRALLHCQLLVAKAFASLAHGSGESAGLLSEAVKVQESLKSVPSEVKGKMRAIKVLTW